MLMLCGAGQYGGLAVLSYLARAAIVRSFDHDCTRPRTGRLLRWVVLVLSFGHRLARHGFVSGPRVVANGIRRALGLLR